MRKLEGRDVTNCGRVLVGMRTLGEDITGQVRGSSVQRLRGWEAGHIWGMAGSCVARLLWVLE